MHSNPEANLPQYLTGGGAPVKVVSLTEFNVESCHALSFARLRNNTIYQAYAESKLLTEEQQAMTFDVLVQISETRNALASTSFMLTSLDEDYHPLEEFYAHMPTNDRWAIERPHLPIEIHQSGKRRTFDRVRQGYLLEHGDTTLRNVIESTLGLSQKDFKQLRERLEQSRRDPHFPTKND